MFKFNRKLLVQINGFCAAARAPANSNAVPSFYQSYSQNQGSNENRKQTNAKGWSFYILSAAGLVGAGTLLYYKQRSRVLCHHGSEDTENEKWKDLKITLYQYQTCPFCCKTRSFLCAYNIPFKSVEVHPIFKKEIKFSKYKKVPIVTIEKAGKIEQLNDSSLIISVLSSYMVNKNLSVADLLTRYPETEIVDDNGSTKKMILNKHWLIKDESEISFENNNDPRSEEAQWRRWTDDHLVHLISPNVYRTFGEAIQAFDYHVKQGRFKGTWEGIVAKYGGAVAMWAISKRLKKKYKLSEDVRIDLYMACNAWVEAIGKHRKFMGGDKPNLADISVYGVLSVMENLDAFHDVLKHSKIKKWYYQTKNAIDKHDGRLLSQIS